MTSLKQGELLGQRDQLSRVREHIQRKDYPEASRLCLQLLRSNPRDVEANLEYGHLAIKMRRHDDAIIIFRKLLAIAPQNTVAHDRLAFLYRLAGDYPNAERHASAALSRDPSLVNARLALASARIAQGRSQEALQIFASLREELPGEIHIEKAFAEALMRIGDFDRARAAIRALARRHPEDASLYSLLSRTHQFEAGSEDTALVEALAAPDGSLTQRFADSEDAVHAYMALHKVEADLGRHQQAFHYLQQAKQLRREQFPYDSSDTERLHRQIRGIFGAELIAAASGAGCTREGPIFIVGMPRSGTTLLERVICSHPETQPGGELHIVDQLVQELCAHVGANQYDYAALARLPPALWAQAGEEYIRRARTLVGDCRYFTDKMPSNFLWAGFIRLMLPGARIIHLSRHPLDNCLSIYQQDFSSSHPWANDLDWLGQHYVIYTETMQHWHAVLADSIIELRYEDLVTDTRATCADLSRHLGMAIPLDQLENSQHQGEILTASQWQARQPIHDESVARWKFLERELQPLAASLDAGGLPAAQDRAGNRPGL